MKNYTSDDVWKPMKILTSIFTVAIALSAFTPIVTDKPGRLESGGARAYERFNSIESEISTY